MRGTGEKREKDAQKRLDSVWSPSDFCQCNWETWTRNNSLFKVLLIKDQWITHTPNIFIRWHVLRFKVISDTRQTSGGYSDTLICVFFLDLSINRSLYPSIYLPTYLPTYLPISQLLWIFCPTLTICKPVSLPVCNSLSLSIYLSIYLSISLSISKSHSLHLSPSLYQSWFVICSSLSLSLSLPLSIYLSIYIYRDIDIFLSLSLSPFSLSLSFFLSFFPSFFPSFVFFLCLCPTLSSLSL